MLFRSTEIEKYAFFGCSMLKEITVPGSVTRIGEAAFCDCLTLSAITVLNPDLIISLGGSSVSSAYISNSGAPQTRSFSEYSGVVYGYKDSTIELYAELEGYTFVALDDKTPVVTTTLPVTTTTKTTTTLTSTKTTTTTTDRKSTRLNSSHTDSSRMPSSA